VPLARRSDEDPARLDMFQVVVNSWEIVKAYSELVDPVEQRRRLEEQMALRDAGDDEAMMLEEDFIEAMEYGMPPMTGLGLGIDRFVALLTDAPNLRDVVLFPQLRGTATETLDDEPDADAE
jgi:lysyl-tRNA synthetase class 2